MDNNKTPTISREALPKFIEDNHRLLTVSEIVEATGFTWTVVGYECRKLKISPITLGERNLAAVKSMLHLTLKEIAQNLGLSEGAIRVYLKILNVAIGSDGHLLKELEVRKEEKKEIVRLEDVEIPQNNYLGPIARRYKRTEPIDLINKFRHGGI